MNMRMIAERQEVPPRRMFTVRDVERMSETGVLKAEDRVELIGGQLVTMNPRGARHETLKLAINSLWGRICPPDMAFIPETTYRLSVDTFIEPDFLVFPRSVGIRGLNAETALLAVELSDSSLGYDLGAKALVYAHFGVRELWVIDAVKLVVHVHRRPEDGRFGSIIAHGAADLVVPEFAPAEFALRLADLDIRD